MGMKTTPYKNNGTVGEIDPRLNARQDTVPYNNGFQRLRNAIVMPFGGSRKRPGTYYVNGVKDKTKYTRAIKFLFNSIQTYVLEFGNQYIRFFKDGGRIEVGGVPVEVSTPFLTANLNNIQFTQDADVMILCDSVNKPYKLIRSGHTSWSMQAFMPTNLNAVGVAINGGTWTESASNAQDNNIATRSAGNTGAYVGRNFSAELKNVRQLRIYGATGSGSSTATLTLKYSDDGSTWTNTNIVSQSIAIDSGWNAFDVNNYGLHQYWAVFCEASSKFMEFEMYEGYFNWYSPVLPDNATSITITPSATTGSISLTASAPIFQAGHVGSMWRIGASGYVVINGVASGTFANAIVRDTLSGTSATNIWAEGAWSAVRGYPSCLTYHNQRLWFANTPTQPQTIWFSKVNAYDNFKVGTIASDGGSYTINGTQTGQIQWLYSDKDLIVGTLSDVFGIKLTVKTSTEVALPEIITGESYGACNIPPVKIGSYLYYVQNNKTTIRELVYNYASESYASQESSLFSAHFFESTIVSIVYQKSPYSILWVLLADGTIAVLVRQIEQEVKGWSLFDTQGLFESICVIPYGSEDQVWIIANRTIQSVTERYLEYFKPFNYGVNLSDAYFLDCGLSVTGVSMTTISGLDHLEGKTVAVFADGAVRTNKTVSSGSITL